MEFREIAKIKTEFVKIQAKGEVAVNYQVKPSAIRLVLIFQI